MMLYGLKVEPLDLALFIFTFVFNILAETIRQRLREKYSSL